MVRQKKLKGLLWKWLKWMRVFSLWTSNTKSELWSLKQQHDQTSGQLYIKKDIQHDFVQDDMFHT